MPQADLIMFLSLPEQSPEYFVALQWDTLVLDVNRYLEVKVKEQAYVEG
jgi:hypothetical protein